MAKVVLLSGYISIGGTQYGFTNVDVNESSNLIDVSDSNDDDLTQRNRSFESDGNKQITMSGDIWYDSAKAIIETGQAYTVVINLEGFTYTGTIWFGSINKNATIDSLIRLSISGNFTGEVT